MARLTSVVDLQEIPFGGIKGAIYRRADIVESSWFFRMHLKQEKRYYRVSLRTRDRAEAFKKAQSVMVRVLAKMETGQSVMAISLELGELVRAFRKHLATQVQSAQIRGTTEKMQRYRIQIGLEFLQTKYPAGLHTRVSAIDGAVFKQYLSWRQAVIAAKREEGTIRRDVVRDELIVIRKMFRYALAQKLCSERQVPIWDFVVEKQASIRRRITNDDIKDFMETVASWRQESENPVDQYHRLVLMHVVLLVESSGMRSGEVFGLRNRHAERLNDDQVRVTIKADTSKVGRDRSIIVRAPFLIEFWIDHAQIFRNPDDYLFSPYKDGKVSARNVFYHSYISLRESLKEFELDWIDLYHCRHWYITERLLAGESIHLVAKAVGTSVSEIEKTYSNVLTEQITEKFSETIVEFDDDGHFKPRKVKLK